MRSAFHWYDLLNVCWANDVFWRATGLPGEYDRETDVVSLWHSPELLVTQACGLDLFCRLPTFNPSRRRSLTWTVMRASTTATLWAIDLVV